LNKRLLNGLRLRVIDSTPTEDFRDVIKSNSIILFKDNFMSLSIAY
jgi:hypothetical protein